MSTSQGYSNSLDQHVGLEEGGAEVLYVRHDDDE
jgi:hypothetical protein